jgi:transcriptional regulator with PAS, ATPase and Fis domain
VPRTGELRAEIGELRDELRKLGRFGHILGSSPPMQKLYDQLGRVSPTSATVLLIGESGTGKELAARAIHHTSPRRANRFVAINCSAIPETLLEAELFGHARGAFTGAIGTRQGRLEQAHKGTLFLDEVGTMSPALQAKLLRVLQEREFERVGDAHTIKIDVRIIAATHSDLAKMVAEGTFREDLFYRLNVIQVALPPLRDRREDLPALAEHFLTRAATKLNRELRLSPPALERLLRYPWPGNVRELENAIERAAILARSATVDVEDLPPHVSAGLQLGPSPALPRQISLADAERIHILQTLERFGGNHSGAAEALGIGRTTLWRKLKEYEIDR